MTPACDCSRKKDRSWLLFLEIFNEATSFGRLESFSRLEMKAECVVVMIDGRPSQKEDAELGLVSRRQPAFSRANCIFRLNIVPSLSVLQSSFCVLPISSSV